MALVDQLQSLRLTDSMRKGSVGELDAHIRRQTVALLQSISPSKLVGDITGPDTLLMLDPYEDTLPFAFMLCAQIDRASQSIISKANPHFIPGGEIWQKILHFFTSFDPIQARYMGNCWTKLVDVTYQMGELGKANQVSATSILATGMRRLDPSGGTLTTAHTDLLRLALITGTYWDALPILDLEIHSLAEKKHIPSQHLCDNHQLSNGYMTVDSSLTSKLEVEDVLDYYLMGGMVYIAVENWPRAMYFLEHVICMPSQGVANGKMLEAYRKWVLVGLIKDGKTPKAPKAANAAALKTLKSAAKVYDAIAVAFDSVNSKRLIAEAHEAQAILQEDANMGLMQRVIQQHRRLTVMKLSNVYAAVTVSRVAEEIELSTKGMTRFLKSLIQDGYLQACLEERQNPDQTVLRFSNCKQGSLDEAGSLAKLMEKTQRIETLTTHVKEADRQLSLSKEYLEFAKATAKGGTGGATGRGSPDALAAPQFHGFADEDELMMND